MTPSCDMEYKVFEAYDANTFQMHLNQCAQEGFVLFKVEFFVHETGTYISEIGNDYNRTANHTTSSAIRYVACMARKKI